MPHSPPVFWRKRPQAPAWRSSRTVGKTTTQRGYGASWRRIRAAVMARDNYLCQVCAADGRVTPATEVDHIRPKARGGTDEMDNLRSICRQCHAEKTARER